MITIQEEANNLFERQLRDWPLARVNYEALNKVDIKEFSFDGFRIKVQFNPERIRSSAAKTDTKSIQERKCFLCKENLPMEQETVSFGDNYHILVNPYPIFPIHFTIPSYKHTDQLIAGRYKDMLDLAESLNEYIIFYNGPKCGASAPDHAHFQAGIKGFLPLEKDIKTVKKKIVLETPESCLYAINGFLRNCFLIISKNKKEVEALFDRLYSTMDKDDDEQEPKLGLFTWTEEDTYYSCIIPREKHRPNCYYSEGEKNMLISPAAVEMGGVLTLALEKDFEKIREKDIRDILQEVCISDSKM